MLYFLRDDSNNLLGFTYNNDTYYYKKNAFDDIIGIYDSNYKEVCTYNYDSYGNILSIKDNTGKDITDTSNVAIINPFRYRSYYYDTETNLYYLNSRYYSPKMGRFINCDDSIGDKGINLTYNLYCYASNSPITNIDDDGNWPKWIGNVVKIAIGVAAIAVGAVSVGMAVGAAASASALGAATTAITAGIKGALISETISATIRGASALTKSIKKHSSAKETIGNIASDSIDGFSNGFMVGGVMAGVSQIASSGFKLATNLGVQGGKNSGGITIGNNIKILSPNAKWKDNIIGGTVIKFSKYFRLDVESKSLLHLHTLFLKKIKIDHFPVGIVISGIFGGINDDN